MSVNVYLNNKVRELGGFKSVPYGDNSGDKMTLNGMNVFEEKGRLHFMWSENDVIPDEFKDLVEEISCYETIPKMSCRESGIYRHETAKCELTPGDHGNAKREKPVYKLKIIAKNLEDIRVIIHKVKTGTIRPEESYENQQGGQSRAELEAGLERMRKENVDLRFQVNTSRAHILVIEKKMVNLWEFANQLQSEGWFCTKYAMAQRIKAILNSY